MAYPGTLTAIVARDQHVKCHTEFLMENLLTNDANSQFETANKKWTATKGHRGRMGVQVQTQPKNISTKKCRADDIRCRPWIFSVTSPPPPFTKPGSRSLCVSASEYGKRMDSNGMIEGLGRAFDDVQARETGISRSVSYLSPQRSVQWTYSPIAPSGVSRRSQQASC